MDKTVVNKYAKALSEVLAAKKDAEKLFDDFFTVVDSIISNRDAVKFFMNPSIKKSVKLEKMEAFLKEIDMPEETTILLKKIIKNNRFEILKYLKEATKKHLYDKLGIVEVHLTLPKKVSEDKKKEFAKLFEKKSGKKVKLSVEIDETIIGGAVAKMGSLLIDGSIKTKILKIKEKLSEEL